MLSESPPSEASSSKDSMNDLFGQKRDPKTKKQLKFISNFNSESEEKEEKKEPTCFSSESLELNLSMSAKKVETVGLNSLNSSQQIFKNNLMENNSSRILKHFEKIQETQPDTVMTSRVMVKDENKLLANEGEVRRPSSFSAQKQGFYNAKKGRSLYANFEKKRFENESIVQSEDGIQVATPDSEFLLNSEVVNVNEFDPDENENIDRRGNENNPFSKNIKSETLRSFHKIKEIPKKEIKIEPLVFKNKLSPLNLNSRKMNPFSIEDPKTERSEYPSENSGKKFKTDGIQNSMKNKNFLMSAGKGKNWIKLKIRGN